MSRNDRRARITEVEVIEGRVHLIEKNLPWIIRKAALIDLGDGKYSYVPEAYHCMGCDRDFLAALRHEHENCRNEVPR